MIGKNGPISSVDKHNEYAKLTSNDIPNKFFCMFLAGFLEAFTENDAV